MLRGGARYGAGRPGWRRKCEHLPSLDIRTLARRGALRAGQYYAWHWSRGDEPAGSVAIATGSDAVTLHYTYTAEDDKPRQVRCGLAIARTPCHFGNSRPWFVCPDCRRRCAVVYGFSQHGNFACRVCQGLVYACEAESLMDRCWRQQHKLEAELLDEGVAPKGMHFRTFERIQSKWEALEAKKDALFLPGLFRLAARLGVPTDDLFK